MSCSCEGKGAAPTLFMPRKAEIVSFEQQTFEERRFTLRMADGRPMDHEPGQFLTVGLMGYGEIPIGFASSPTRPGGTFDIVVRKVGRVSTAIDSMGEGDSLMVRGPLGHGFDLDALRAHDVLIVAGGLGICPTRSLIQYILDRRSEFGRFMLFYGSRDPQSLLFDDDRRLWEESDDIEYYETVDRGDSGWHGRTGVITTLFPEVEVPVGTKVIICGPPIMFKFTVMVLDDLGIPHGDVYVDLERRMKCGVGKCGHCQINEVYCCTDGPVFNFEDIESIPEAI